MAFPGQFLLNCHLIIIDLDKRASGITEKLIKALRARKLVQNEKTGHLSFRNHIGIQKQR